MSHPDSHNLPKDPSPRVHHWWRQLWAKAQVPLQVIAGQLIGWALRKWLGE